jgi:hypothetical protein
LTPHSLHAYSPVFKQKCVPDLTPLRRSAERAGGAPAWDGWSWGLPAGHLCADQGAHNCWGPVNSHVFSEHTSMLCCAVVPNQSGPPLSSPPLPRSSINICPASRHHSRLLNIRPSIPTKCCAGNGGKPTILKRADESEPKAAGKPMGGRTPSPGFRSRASSLVSLVPLLPRQSAVSPPRPRRPARQNIT